jgi:hypothetical protein
MAIAFDSLGYARHLRDHGVPPEQAEAHADAARTYIMQELVTREDLRVALDNLDLRLSTRIQAQTIRLGVMRAGSGNLDRRAEWSFCLTAARMAAGRERR